ERAVHVRVGALDGRLYLDLGDEAWRAVEISAAGWRVIANPPVRFRRAAGMQPLPVPVPGGSVETLRSFLNVQSDTDFVLVVAWALAVLRDRGPYPVLALSGEQGSAKSTFSAILGQLFRQFFGQFGQSLFTVRTTVRRKDCCSNVRRRGTCAAGSSGGLGHVDHLVCRDDGIAESHGTCADCGARADRRRPHAFQRHLSRAK